MAESSQGKVQKVIPQAAITTKAATIAPPQAISYGSSRSMTSDNGLLGPLSGYRMLDNEANSLLLRRYIYANHGLEGIVPQCVGLTSVIGKAILDMIHLLEVWKKISQFSTDCIRDLLGWHMAEVS